VRISTAARTQRRCIANRTPPGREPRAEQGGNRERESRTPHPECRAGARNVELVVETLERRRRWRPRRYRRGGRRCRGWRRDALAVPVRRSTTAPSEAAEHQTNFSMNATTRAPPVFGSVDSGKGRSSGAASAQPASQTPRALGHGRTLWITPEEGTVPPVRTFRPGGMGGGRHLNTTGSLAFPRRTAPWRSNDACAGRHPRAVMRVMDHAGRRADDRRAPLRGEPLTLGR